MARPRVGLLGGTFDPVHNGHLFLALEAMHAAQLERVILIPNRVPPHKAAPGVGTEDRWRMLQAAIETEPRLEACRIELDREGPSYTLDTVQALSSDYQLTFICGADAFRASWHRPEAVLELLDGVVMAHRFGVPPGLPPLLAQLPEPLRRKVYHLEFPDIAISSTDLRQRIAEGRPIRYLVPETVYQEIFQHGLYTIRPALGEGAERPDEKASR